MADHSSKISSHHGGNADARETDGFLVRETVSRSPNFSPELQCLEDACPKCAPSAFNDVRIYYLALPPSQFGPVATCVRKHLIREEHGASLGRHRLIVEKPFGRDLQTSNALTRCLRGLFAECSIYRIDHYLGKEMVKSIGTLRFANRIFSALWSREHISSVQIVFKETIGVDGRGGYFDEYGILRDVMQNHLLQILSILAMEPPADYSADAVRDSKVAVLRCIRPPGAKENAESRDPDGVDGSKAKDCHKDKESDDQDIVLGQYTASDTLPGYLDDPSVSPNSTTPTFAMCVLNVDNDRWMGVPFILRCGKALDEQKAEIRIQFRPLDPVITSYFDLDPHPNELVIRVQPQESVYVKMNVKRPGFGVSAG
jgi:glucose-6-phosphate 1-dehydrogenase